MSKKENIIQKVTQWRVILAIQVIASLILIGLLFKLGALPMLYAIIVIILLALLNVRVFFLMKPSKNKKKGKVRTVIGKFVSILLSVLLLVGSLYIAQRNSLIDAITGANTETTRISVVVMEKSKYKELSDLKGETIEVNMSAETEKMEEAIKALKNEESSIKTKEVDEFAKMADDLYKGTTNAIFVNEAYYAMLEANHPNFETETRVIWHKDITVKTNDISKNVDVTKAPFVVYISGIDTYGKVSTVSRTDVNMIVTVNPKTKQILMTSIPRDYYVTLANKGKKDKLTHSGLGGIENTVKTMENFMGIDINYYARVNFTSLIKMVDALGNKTSGDASLCKVVKFNDLDTTTYSKSIHTGKEITNQFDFADINKYEGNGNQTVTYLTRNNWTETMPKEAPKLSLTEKMGKDLQSKLDLKQTKKDAEAYFKDHGEIKYNQPKKYSLIQMKGLPYDASEWDELLNQMSWDEQAELCSNGYHTTALVESINKPATRDENGPLGISVTFSTSSARKSMGWPCEPTRAATFNKPLSKLFGQCVGEDMLHAKVTGLWGYGLNIHRTPYSGRNFEYYSEDSFLSGEVCAQETIGAQSKGSFIMVKHFAANDSETQRHGNNEWMSEQTLREIYLSPFEKEFTEGGAGSTMTSYNRLGTQWAGGCYSLLTTVLRGEWGFKGYTSSDYAGKSKGNYAYYQNVYTGIQAGCDTYDANFHKDEYDGLQDDKVFQYCLRISSKRICYTILNTAVMNGLSSSTKVVYINTWWQNALIALEVSCGALTLGFASWLTLHLVKSRKEGEVNE